MLTRREILNAAKASSIAGAMSSLPSVGLARESAADIMTRLELMFPITGRRITINKPDFYLGVEKDKSGKIIPESVVIDSSRISITQSSLLWNQIVKQAITVTRIKGGKVTGTNEYTATVAFDTSNNDPKKYRASAVIYKKDGDPQYYPLYAPGETKPMPKQLRVNTGASSADNDHESFEDEMRRKLRWKYRNMVAWRSVPLKCYEIKDIWQATNTLGTYWITSFYAGSKSFYGKVNGQLGSYAKYWAWNGVDRKWYSALIRTDGQTSDEMLRFVRDYQMALDEINQAQKDLINTSIGGAVTVGGGVVAAANLSAIRALIPALYDYTFTDWKVMNYVLALSVVGIGGGLGVAIAQNRFNKLQNNLRNLALMLVVLVEKKAQQNVPWIIESFGMHEEDTSYAMYGADSAGEFAPFPNSIANPNALGPVEGVLLESVEV